MGKFGLRLLDSSDQVRLCGYAVLVTDADHRLKTIGQLCRDRADCENGFAYRQYPRGS